jgi:hypothetical protein
MPVFLQSLLGTLAGIGSSMLVSLVTETFLKKQAVRVARLVAKKTKNEDDDGLVEDMAEAWGVK